MSNNVVISLPTSNNISITTDETSVNISNPITNIVEVVSLGPQGPIGFQGPQGIPGSITSHTDLIVTGSIWASGSNGHITASGNIIASSFTGSLYGTSSIAITASYALANIITASNDFAEVTFTKGNGSTFLINATPRKVIESVKNTSGIILAKGTPCYVSGSTGNTTHIYPADAGDASKMPATIVLDEQLANGQEGYGIISGFINGVNTSTFQEGQNVYVAVGGGYTNVKPTGSALVQKLGNVVKVGVNGSGLITGAGRTNDIPNITSGYVWVGDNNQVPTPTSTASLLVNTASFALTASYVLDNENLGRVIGYQLAPSTQTLTLSGSTTGSFTNLSASFISPSNGKILVELANISLSSENEGGSSIRYYQIGLSSTLGSFTTVKDYKNFFSLPQNTGNTDSGIFEVSSKWIIENLTPGQSYTYYFFFNQIGASSSLTQLYISSISGQTAVIMTSLP